MSTFRRSEKGYPFLYNQDSSNGVVPLIALVDPTTGTPYSSSTPGLLPVDTLGTPAVARVQATSGTAASIVLTTTCRRLSMFATTGTWYSISGTATSSSHYIGASERLDIDVPASTTVSVLQETSAGSIRITELT
jgi:hypothetical protein